MHALWSYLQYVKPDATVEEMIRAMEQASATSLLSRSEHGIHTQIGERKVELIR